MRRRCFYRSDVLIENKEAPLLCDEKLERFLLTGLHHYLVSILIPLFCLKKTRIDAECTFCEFENFLKVVREFYCREFSTWWKALVSDVFPLRF